VCLHPDNNVVLLQHAPSSRHTRSVMCIRFAKPPMGARESRFTDKRFKKHLLVFEEVVIDSSGWKWRVDWTMEMRFWTWKALSRRGYSWSNSRHWGQRLRRKCWRAAFHEAGAANLTTGLTEFSSPETRFHECGRKCWRAGRERPSSSNLGDAPGGAPDDSLFMKALALNRDFLRPTIHSATRPRETPRLQKLDVVCGSMEMPNFVNWRWQTTNSVGGRKGIRLGLRRNYPWVGGRFITWQCHTLISRSLYTGAIC